MSIDKVSTNVKIVYTNVKQLSEYSNIVGIRFHPPHPSRPGLGPIALKKAYYMHMY